MLQEDLRVLNTPEITCAAQSRTASDITIHQGTVSTDECTSSILLAMSRTPGLSWLFMAVPSLSGSITDDSFSASSRSASARKKKHPPLPDEGSYSIITCEMLRTNKRSPKVSETVSWLKLNEFLKKRTQSMHLARAILHRTRTITTCNHEFAHFHIACIMQCIKHVFLPLLLSTHGTH